MTPGHLLLWIVGAAITLTTLTLAVVGLIESAKGGNDERHPDSGGSSAG
ncbi:MAG: hypothetical protein PWP37_847 [Thermotogota bacterium]|nr:hypothetical protein [Thermotogota bacterium]MDK2864655.1 hypothetical protein [Thermotogota bacterium]